MKNKRALLVLWTIPKVARRVVRSFLFKQNSLFISKQNRKAVFLKAICLDYFNKNKMRNNLILTQKFILPVILIVTILFILNHFIFEPIRKAENYLQKGHYTVGEVFRYKIIEGSESNYSEIEFKCLANNRYYTQKYANKLKNITRGQTFLALFIEEDLSNTLMLLHYRPVSQEYIKTNKDWKVTKQDAKYASPVKIGAAIIFIVLCLFVYPFFYLLMRDSIKILRLKEEVIPTVGIITEKKQSEIPEGGSFDITYTFHLDTDQYLIGKTSTDRDIQIGQRFSVFYDPKKPSDNIILLDNPVF